MLNLERFERNRKRIVKSLYFLCRPLRLCRSGRVYVECIADFGQLMIGVYVNRIKGLLLTDTSSFSITLCLFFVILEEEKNKRFVGKS